MRIFLSPNGRVAGSDQTRCLLQIKSFISFCGGLPSPELSNAPLGYKFSYVPPPCPFYLSHIV